MKEQRVLESLLKGINRLNEILRQDAIVFLSLSFL